METNQVIEGLEFEVPLLDLWGGEKGWRLSSSPMVNDIISHAYVRSLQKTQKYGLQRASGLVSTRRRWESDTLRESREAPHHPPHPALRISSIWLFLSSILL